MHNNSELKRRPRSDRGFTLIELLTVVAVLVVIAALAAPDMSRLLNARRVEDAARRLAEDLSLSRSEAIKRNAAVLVCAAPSGSCDATPASAAWAGGWRVCYDNDVDGACDEATSSADPNPIRARSSIHAALTLTGPQSRLRFNANGSLTASAFTDFEVRSSSNNVARYVVRIAPSGAISVRKG